MKIWFDMDGTVADLYGVENWLEMLRAEDATPYIEATPMCDMLALNEVLLKLALAGVEIGVISWTAMNGSREYNKAVRAAKVEWLRKFMPIVHEIHVVKYGTPKHSIGKGILIDDNAEVRNAWHGETIDPTEKDIVEELKKILAQLV